MWGERVICPGVSIQREGGGRLHGIARTMTACLHVRSQASSLIGLGEAAGRSTGLQQSGQACMPVARSAYRLPESEAHHRYAEVAQGGWCKWLPRRIASYTTYRDRTRGHLAGSANCVLAGSRSPFGIP